MANNKSIRRGKVYNLIYAEQIINQKRPHSKTKVMREQNNTFIKNTSKRGKRISNLKKKISEAK